ncbi:MAG: site-2 protease family protein, partial [Burkholderiaceae bacterium]|nr:site-2 protease family protein [Burkholderiaceae bacterium]
FAFNLFPLPPLDGGRIVVSLLPYRWAYQFSRIEQYGFFIVLALAYFKIIHFWMMPVMFVANVLLHLLVFPLNFILK